VFFPLPQSSFRHARAVVSALFGISLVGSFASAQTATQILLTSPSSGDGTPFSVDTVGRHQDNKVLTRSTTHNGDIAQATNTTSWDLNPAGGFIQVSSQSDYDGWQGSGVSLDSRYAFAVFDTFSIGAGDSGFSNGDDVQLNLSLSFVVSAQTDGEKFQTASNWLSFTVQQRDPVPGYLGQTYSDELFSLDYEVTVYEFIETAVINGVEQFDNTVTYVNGQGNEADVYAFDITLDAVVGETLELGMMLGDFNPNVYDYDILNLVSGTRQDIGNSQVDYGNQFAATFRWDIEAVVGVAGLDVAAASGFAPSISAVPEPSTYAAMAGLAVLGWAGWRRRGRGRRADLV
jgi:hypothetical protein